MNKKGQADLTGNILKTMPKPVLFIFFVMLLGVIGFVLNPVFNSFGIYCKSTQEVVKIPNGNLFSNIALMNKLPGMDEISGENIDPDGWFVKCKEFHNGSFRLVDYGCSDCDIISDMGSNLGFSGSLCEGDAYKKSDEDLSWFNRKIKCPVADCTIPKNYYYEVDSGMYECENQELCTNTKLAVSRDAKLDEVGSVPAYTSDTTDASYDKVFKFSCTNKLKVEPTIAGIPFLNPAIWMILMLISVLIWVLMHFNK